MLEEDEDTSMDSLLDSIRYSGTIEYTWEDVYNEEVKKEEELFRKIQDILNNFTPQKFQNCISIFRQTVEQLKILPINTVKKLEGTVNLIYEKAIHEPNFSVQCANLCKQLALMRVPLEGAKSVNFRKILLTKCQIEFEQDKSVAVEKIRQEKIKEMKNADDEEKRKEFQLQLDEEEKKIRMRQLGNIRFIGELFKLNMLIAPIMHECIKKLLAKGDEESLECLCTLLKIIGKTLDEEDKLSQDAKMDSHFFSLQKIVDKGSTSSRIRIMLQDVIYLRKNNWVPGIDERSPKTIEQIHKEAEKDAGEVQQAVQNIPCSKCHPDDCRNISDDEEALLTTSLASLPTDLTTLPPVFQKHLSFKGTVNED